MATSAARLQAVGDDMHDETVTRITPARGPGAGPCLCVIEGPSGGAILYLSDADALIGRHPDCQMVLESTAVSKQHARVSCRDGGFLLDDVGSTNGTTVNASPLTSGEPRLLCHGDIILMGDHTLIFRQDSGTFADKKGMSTISLDLSEIQAEADRLMGDWMKDA